MEIEINTCFKTIMNMGGLSPQSCEDTKQKKDCQNAKIINHKSNSQKQYQSKFRV